MLTGTNRVNRQSFLRWTAGLVTLFAVGAHADLPDTITRIKPSVVIVGTYRATDAPRFRLRGTGFVVGNGNTVVTNFHVLPEATENQADLSLVVQVRGANNQLSMRQATVLETDRVHDLAVLRIEGAAVASLVIRNSDTVREGQAIAFMGFPIGGALGFTPVTHRGIVSSPVVFRELALRETLSWEELGT